MIHSNDLKRIKVISEPLDTDMQEFMIKYINHMSNFSGDPELRAQWTMILKSIGKQIGRR